ncbi:helix-turn-helix domain-containing protein [Acetivibrio sp. MSJd-27]|uniref:helix-turn-helix domain-containing protein n=1 Tax=Acetivibrio sp. MSJd-27 TaxID=2841523 RepID=UPI0035ABA5DE
MSGKMVIKLDIHKRMKELMEERNWTEYKLAKEAGLSQSTISNLFKRNMLPTIPTLEAICGSFGLTLSQFFAEGNIISLTSQQKELINCWNVLSEEQKEALLQLMKTLKKRV